MIAVLRCDQCDAYLGERFVERDRKRFCCSECLHAFDIGMPKSVSPHRHPEAMGQRWKLVATSY
jgi:hypothetical protein